ncbi:hypothetical protein FRC07_013016, partial [Ceratobasidium sp. 392]
MAASSLHPPSSNPFRDPNRTSPSLTPQPTGSSSLNPFLSHNERISPQATGASESHHFTPEHTGTNATRVETQNTGSGAFLTPQATGAFVSAQPTGAFVSTQTTGVLNSQDTGISQWRSSASSAVPTDEFATLSISEPRTTYSPPSGPPP